jgi:SAM-dependent methyltransferase
MNDAARREGALTDDTARAAVHFRFYDNREKYLLFVTTTNEKAMIAEQVGHELRFIKPRPPALSVFDAGMGDGMVLSRVMRRLHRRFPTVPWFVVGKEISVEDVRLTLDKLPERFFEHPQMVVAITNMYYSEAPSLRPRSGEETAWIELELDGGSTEEFEAQIAGLLPRLAEIWRVKTSPKTGNPLRERPAVIVLYRKDQRLALDQIIPRPDEDGHNYDLIIASQPYRARESALAQARMVLAPLARVLAPGGRLVTVQSYGRDPGMEIINGLWPNDDPFRTPRHDLLEATRQSLGSDAPPGLRYLAHNDERALFRYALHTMATEVGDSIGTSTLLAAWNAAVYVAQIEDERMTEALSSAKYLEVTRATLRRHGGLWFNDEMFVIARRV